MFLAAPNHIKIGSINIFYNFRNFGKNKVSTISNVNFFKK